MCLDLLSVIYARVPHSPLSLSPFDAQAVLDCKGTVFFSGVGKSGFISQKISMTLVSTGTKSVFLNPTDALHGDIGGDLHSITPHYKLPP